jgi:hypothetical protein
MLYSISWFAVLALLGIWSTLVWVLHFLVVWSLKGAGALAGQPGSVDGFPTPDWLAAWIPPDLVSTIEATAAAVLPWVESVFEALPSFAAWLAPVAWVVWGIGFVILALGAVALHALIFATRRTASP